MMAFSAVDVAPWDLKSRLYGLPLADRRHLRHLEYVHDCVYEGVKSA